MNQNINKINGYLRLTFDPKRDSLYVYLIKERTNKCY
jgi:uncharacterized membrane protein affecting hemolysin expression